MAPKAHVVVPFTDGKTTENLLLMEGDNLELLTVRMEQNGWYPAVTYKEVRLINKLDEKPRPRRIAPDGYRVASAHIRP